MDGNETSQTIILGDTDRIRHDDWCRPLNVLKNAFGNVMPFSDYGGKPINNLKWIRARDILGTFWFGKTVGEHNSGPSSAVLEFARGPMPSDHIYDGPMNASEVPLF